ncbi:glucans biosynthesis protein [Neorhodopirellula lusitana]|uniref:Glucans biosynthesis protein n=1 Tax=Neorhodopirellula lusitana TaxID=445327 RepID=A0ABY1PNP7_9BACT|nr:glucan biosynthesis protein [Neorhodopirellula lusitana]SMP39863.1 glucans biosynthesis protein [Neorhodopirellula lusitana]
MMNRLETIQRFDSNRPHRFLLGKAVATALISMASLVAQPSTADELQVISSTSISADEVTSLADLKLYAKSLAKEPYRPEPPLAPELADLNYEQYREIQFRHEAGIWDDGSHPFWLEFFHRGFVQRDRVDVYVIEPNEDTDAPPIISQVQYTAEQFDFGDKISDLQVPDDVGYAGLKVAGRFATDGDAQEMLTFIGSSYFRSRTQPTVYGTSARGLAVNIGMNQDEEFPDFRAFWITEPTPNEADAPVPAKIPEQKIPEQSDDTLKSDDTSPPYDIIQPQITVLALLDSPSLTGAYQFTFVPNKAVSTIEVEATLFFRNAVDKLAYAPLTSMWLWGDGLQGPSKDERPSVHDSDGLLVHADNRWQWRSLARLPYPSVSSITVESLNGFGLLQRDRDFEHFLDSNARYHDRPSVWIEPIDSFGPGRIELLEIPGAHEGIDNIGAYFVPDNALPDDQGSQDAASDEATPLPEPIDLKYRVSFFATATDLGDKLHQTTPTGQPLATCQSLDIQRNGADEPIDLELVFELKSQPDTAPEVNDSDATEAAPVQAAIHTVRGQVSHQTTKAIPNGYVCRLSITPTEDAPIELELTLQDADGQAVSETFRYLCPQAQPTFKYPAVYTRQE